MKDTKGNRIADGKAGSQVVLEASITSNCEISNYPILIQVGVIDSEGRTTFFAFQNTTMSQGDQTTAGFSWMPKQAGDYELVVFAHACLKCSGDFGIVDTMDFTVVAVASKSDGLERYTLSTGNETFDIPYRFSSGEGEIQSLDIQLYWPAITLIVDNPQDSTLEIHLPVELLKQLEIGSDLEYCVGFPFAVFIDEESSAVSDVLEQNDKEEVLAIQLEKGSKVIEVIGTSLLYEPPRCP